MVQVLVAGLIALASKWLLDGGIRRRERHVIREELELANLLGDTPEAADLRVMAHARLVRYLRPPLMKRAAPAVRTVLVFAVAVAAGEVVLASAPDDMSDARTLTAALAVGMSVGVLAQVVQGIWGFIGRLRDEEAEVFGWPRR